MSLTPTVVADGPWRPWRRNGWTRRDVTMMVESVMNKTPTPPELIERLGPELPPKYVDKVIDYLFVRWDYPAIASALIETYRNSRRDKPGINNL